MSNHMEGKKMDPKLAAVLERIKVEHPAPAVDAVNDPFVLEQTVAMPEQRKKKPRHFVTFIEKSLPPRDRE